jgi:hypothetical protein
MRILALGTLLGIILAASQAHAETCVTVEATKERLAANAGRVDVFGSQGVTILNLAYRRVYGVALRDADAALVFDWRPDRFKGTVHVVLFKDSCAIGQGDIARQIYHAMLRGRKA